MNFSWNAKNSKLQKDGIVSFSIPPVLTCPKAGSCKSLCYAQKGLYSFLPSINQSMDNNYQKVKIAIAAKNLSSQLSDDIQGWNKKGKFHFRIHSAGDFFSKQYLTEWFLTCKFNPSSFFYAYTKSIHLIRWDDIPENLTLIQSFGGMLDKKINPSYPFSIVLPNGDEARFLSLCEKYHLKDGSKSDYYALNGTKRLALKKHPAKIKWNAGDEKQLQKQLAIIENWV